MAFKSGAAKLRQLATYVRHWPTDVRRDAGERFKVKAGLLLQQQHARGSGPGGAQWDEPKAGGRKMDKSGNLKGGYIFYVVATSTGVSLRVDNRMPYSKFLQDGTPNMRRRLMVPALNSPVPRDWKEAARQSWAEAQVDYWRRHRVS